MRKEGDYLRISRLSIVLVGVIAFVCSIPDFALILRIVSFAIAIVGSAFFFPLLVGMTSKRVSRAAALASSVGGTVAACVWIAATLAGAPWSASLHPGIVGLATSGLLMLFVNLATRPISGAAVQKYFPEAT